jgi:hypothetical protein
MKYFLSLLLIGCLTASAQPITYDIANFTLPKGWTKTVENNSAVQYTKQEGTKWAQVSVYKNTTSLGSPDADFDSEWEKLVVIPYKAEGAPVKTPVENAMGEWKKISGSGKWNFNGKEVTTTMTTFTGYGACISFVINISDPKFTAVCNEVLASVQLQQVNTGTTEPTGTITENPTPPVNNPTTSIQTGYKFNSTTFDDGWVSTIQEDWVQVEKGPIKVLIHYPKEGTIFPADPDVLTTAAWNILVAPRYSGLSNFKTSYVQDYKRPYFGTGYATETISGQQKLVVLFRRGGGWIEVICPDNATFTREFGFNPESIAWGKVSEYSGGWVVTNSAGTIVNADPEVFNKLENMVTYNRFAVAASDLDGTGKWNAGYSSNTFYANYYTGAYAGMTTYSSSQWFDFKAGQKYHWELVAANSGMGQIQTAQAKSDGSFKSINDWQLLCSNIEGKPKTYDAYFTAIKGGRVLWLNDAKAPGSGIFTGFSR